MTNHNCDPQALQTAAQLIFNPTYGKGVEELETAQSSFKLYNSLCYGYRALLLRFGNERQYFAVRDQLPAKDDPNYKDARKRLIYNPVKQVVARYLEELLKAAGSEAEFLRNYSAKSEETIRSLIDSLLSTALNWYWTQITLNPDTEHRHPELLKVRIENGVTEEIPYPEQLKAMRRCLLRLNEEELQEKRKLNQRFSHQVSHAETVISRGGEVNQPGASNFFVDNPQSQLGAYCVLSLDFNRGEWECLARIRDQQGSFRYADEQRRVAPEGVLIRAFRDAQHEFGLGVVGTFQSIRRDLYKSLQIPHLKPQGDKPPVLVTFSDTKKIEGTWFWEALNELLKQQKAQYHAKSASTEPVETAPATV